MTEKENPRRATGGKGQSAEILGTDSKAGQKKQELSLVDYAIAYLKKSMHPIPVGLGDERKRPFIKWEKYQNTPPTEAEIRDGGASGRMPISGL